MKKGNTSFSGKSKNDNTGFSRIKTSRELWQNKLKNDNTSFGEIN